MAVSKKTKSKSKDLVVTKTPKPKSGPPLTKKELKRRAKNQLGKEERKSKEAKKKKKKKIDWEKSIVLSDKVYIPRRLIDAELVKETYTHHMYEENACRKCDNKPDRPNYICEQCPSEGYRGCVRTSNTKTKKGVQYVGVPIGDRNKMEKKLHFSFDDFPIVDARVKKKFRYNVKMKGFEYRDYQEKAKNDWMEYGHGLIVAPPRSGKTPTMLALCIELGYRFIVLANQHDFLKQFEEHIESMTNLPKLEKQTGKKLFGYAKKPEDFDDLEICLCTYQQFTHAGTKSQARFNAAKKNFGTLFVDEVHKANADKFASVLNSWPAMYKGGVTGTDKRKDGREFVVRELLGPVTSRVQIAQLKAAITVDIFDGKPRSAYNSGPGAWTYANKWLAGQEKYIDMILAKVGRDLAKGRSIIIPCMFKDQIFHLTKMINELYGAKTAESFVGGGGDANKRQREGVIENARAYKTRVVVGTRSLVQLGINIPRWDTLYVIVPISNEPNWKQESSRILTPLDDKRKPIIRFFVTPALGQSLGCFCNTYRQTIKFGHEPTKKGREQAHELLALHGGKRGANDDFDEGSTTPVKAKLDSSKSTQWRRRDNK